jgi:hypothetical protein
MGMLQQLVLALWYSRHRENLTKGRADRSLGVTEEVPTDEHQDAGR